MPVAYRLKPVVPEAVRWRLVRARVVARRPTASARMLPDALLIGAQRSGTSSLFRYLAAHPNVGPPVRKEVGYFTRRYSAGEGWYRAHFPLAVRRRLTAGAFVTFDATPDYLVHPYAAERAARLVPGARVVVLLRDPVERAASHYRHMVRVGFEELPLEEAIEREPERLAGDLARLRQDPGHDPRSFLRHSYVTRGLYAEQLARWFECFPSDRVLIIESAELFSSPERAFGAVVAFLGLPPWTPRRFPNVSARSSGGSEPPISPVARRALQERFAGPDRELAALLGRTPGWA